MKAWIFLPFVLLAGLVIGGWGPRSELASVRKQVKDLKNQVAKASPRTGGFNSVTRMLGVDPEAARAGARRSRPATPGLAPSNSVAAATNTTESASNTMVVVASADAAGEITVEESPKQHRHDRKNLEEQLEEAYKLWETRSAMARATFLDNTGLSEEEAMQFDVLMEAMNVRLADSIGRLADDLKEGSEMTPEKGVRLANEVTGAFVQTYDEMDRTMPETWRDDAGQNFKLFDFVDPYVASPMIGVEDKLEGGFMGGM